jgi:hypothetical protein
MGLGPSLLDLVTAHTVQLKAKFWVCRLEADLQRTAQRIRDPFREPLALGIRKG